MAEPGPDVGGMRAGTWFLVAAQRRPWAGSALAALAALHLLALPLPFLGVPSIGPVERGLIGAVAAAFAAHIVAQAPSWLDRAAAFVTGNAVVVAFAATDAFGGPWRASGALTSIACALAASAWTLAVPVLPPRSKALVLVEATGLAAMTAAASGHLNGRSVADVAALVGSAGVLSAFAAAETSAAARCAAGAVLGAALGAVHLFLALGRPPTEGRIAATLAGSVLAGAFFGLLASVARAARSLSALPTDHPSFTDFAAGRPRGAS